MKIKQNPIAATGIKFSISRDGEEVGRAYLYLMYNGLHDRPFGFMEDVYVDEAVRGEGIGTELVKEIVHKARELNCYKLIATSRTSRPQVHELYERLGFRNHGVEFRVDFEVDDA